ncbi:MAG: hypothetical protein DDT18_00973 [Actinobacteria bacterium]|nr:hypothetical protein [Actinomycetota bacterium]
MEWLGVAYMVLGLAGLSILLYSYLWIYRRGVDKGFQKGVKAAEDHWQAEKLKIYADIQKKAEVVKATRRGARIVD